MKLYMNKLASIPNLNPIFGSNENERLLQNDLANLFSLRTEPTQGQLKAFADRVNSTAVSDQFRAEINGIVSSALVVHGMSVTSPQFQVFSMFQQQVESVKRESATPPTELTPAKLQEIATAKDALATATVYLAVQPDLSPVVLGYITQQVEPIIPTITSEIYAVKARIQHHADASLERRLVEQERPRPSAHDHTASDAALAQLLHQDELAELPPTHYSARQIQLINKMRLPRQSADNVEIMAFVEFFKIGIEIHDKRRPNHTEKLHPLDVRYEDTPIKIQLRYTGGHYTLLDRDEMIHAGDCFYDNALAGINEQQRAQNLPLIQLTADDVRNQIVDNILARPDKYAPYIYDDPVDLPRLQVPTRSGIPA